MEINKVYQEPCLETLKKMPNDFLDCVITSPPYYQLRDYGYEGQWGLEPTYQEYLEHLWEMMDEIYRVLKPTGTCWINLGDSYSGSGGSGGDYNVGGLREGQNKVHPPKNQIKNKCLMLIPHRFAIGCIDRGWIMRNDIIWAKRNGMPESVTDRFSKKHEYIFFMTKNEKYYFDLDSVRDKVKLSSLERYQYAFKGNKNGEEIEWMGYNEGDKTHLIPSQLDNQYSIHPSKYSSQEVEAEHRQGMHKNRGENLVEKRPNLPTQIEFVQFLKSRIKMSVLCESTNIPKTTIEHWFRNDEKGFSFPSVSDWNEIKEFLDNWDDEFYDIDFKMTYVEYETDDINKNSEKGKNCGDVADFWDITTKPNKSSHYATYNDELLRKPILAGCPEGGLIYDPFMGSGTTAEGAIRAKRNFIGSEMSTDYLKICNERIQKFHNQPTLF